MNENSYPSAQIMIKIDGARIKAIREAKGLTQLYIATAVDVTTDTVSRWENRRYPTIKKENGLKLAEALEVELDEILDAAEQKKDSESTEDPASRPEAAETGLNDSDPGPLQEPQHGVPATNNRWFDKIGHLGIILITIILLCAGFYSYTLFNRQSAVTDISVSRILAPHFVAGQPLPVFLLVEKADDTPLSIILKESLPPGCRLESAVPPLSGSSSTEIKWLTKISQSALFFYTVVTDPSFNGDVTFDGTVKSGRSNNIVHITGESRTVSGAHHWADSDGDNRISDEEILVVYDLLSGDTDRIIDLDQLEEMWLGDGYLWNRDQQTFTIME